MITQYEVLQGGPPNSYKLSYTPYIWPYKWETGAITLLIGVILRTSYNWEGPTLYDYQSYIYIYIYLFLFPLPLAGLDVPGS